MPVSKIASTVIPATPGWSVAHLIRAGARWEEGLLLDPVIAWAIVLMKEPEVGNWYEVTPITADGAEEDGNWALKRPNGTFHIPRDCMFETESEVLSYLKALADAPDRQPRARPVPAP